MQRFGIIRNPNKQNDICHLFQLRVATLSNFRFSNRLHLIYFLYLNFGNCACGSFLRCVKIFLYFYFSAFLMSACQSVLINKIIERKRRIFRKAIARLNTSHIFKKSVAALH